MNLQGFLPYQTPNMLMFNQNPKVNVEDSRYYNTLNTLVSKHFSSLEKFIRLICFTLLLDTYDRYAPVVNLFDPLSAVNGSTPERTKLKLTIDKKLKSYNYNFTTPDNLLNDLLGIIDNDTQKNIIKLLTDDFNKMDFLRAVKAQYGGTLTDEQYNQKLKMYKRNAGQYFAIIYQNILKKKNIEDKELDINKPMWFDTKDRVVEGYNTVVLDSTKIWEDSDVSYFNVFNFQVDAINWLLYLYGQCTSTDPKYDNNMRGGILADNMGLGKTRDCIAFCEIAKPDYVLVACIKATVTDWFREALNTAKSCNIYSFESGGFQKVTLDASGVLSFSKLGHGMLPMKPAIIISNYEIIRYNTNLRVLMNIYWNAIFADEGHRMRTGDSIDIYNAMNSLPRAFNQYNKLTGMRVAVTGTPIENVIYDIINIYSWVDNRYFSNGSYDENYLLNVNYTNLFRRSKNQIQESLKKIIRFPEEEPIVETIVIDFPETDLSRYLENLSPEQIAQYTNDPNNLEMVLNDERAYYIAYMAEIKYNDIVKAAGGTYMINNGQASGLKEQTSVRTALSSPYDKTTEKTLKNQHFKGVSTKIRMIIELIKILNGESLVVFHSFKNIATMAAAEINKYLPNVSTSQINGDVDNKERDRIIETNKTLVKNGGISVLFSSIAATNEGVNYQHTYNNAAFLDQEWNPKIIDQASARIDRIGQSKRVRKFHFLIKPFRVSNIWISLDQEINQVKNEKASLSDIIETKPNAAWFFKRKYCYDENGKYLPGSNFGDYFESLPKAQMVNGYMALAPEVYGPEDLATFDEPHSKHLTDEDKKVFRDINNKVMNTNGQQSVALLSQPILDGSQEIFQTKFNNNMGYMSTSNTF